MPETDFFTLFTDRFNSRSIEYMVTGSAVALAFGEPRLTNDIDVVLKLIAEDVEGFAAAFPDSEYYFPPEEVLQIEIARRTRGHFNIIHHRTGLKADCYLAGEDPFQSWGLSRRTLYTLDMHEVYFAPLEYVIVKKLQFFEEGKAEKHIRDIRGMLAVSGELVDSSLVEKFVHDFRLEAAWSHVLNKN